METLYFVNVIYKHQRISTPNHQSFLLFRKSQGSYGFHWVSFNIFHKGEKKKQKLRDIGKKRNKIQVKKQVDNCFHNVHQGSMPWHMALLCAIRFHMVYIMLYCSICWHASYYWTRHENDTNKPFYKGGKIIYSHETYYFNLYQEYKNNIIRSLNIHGINKIEVKCLLSVYCCF